MNRLFIITSLLVPIFSMAVVAEKNIVVVIPSYNNASYYKQNLDSVFAQKYDNYKVIYIDDCSPDGTGELVGSYLQERNQNDYITLIKNKERCGALANIYSAVHACDDNAIIVTLDGDDWFAHENVLATINKEYMQNDIWMTYGQFKFYPCGTRSDYGALADWVIDAHAYRSCGWTTTHLRTFYSWLFKRIDKEDFLQDGQFFSVAWDMAFMFPMLEMSGHRSKFMSEVLYVYNVGNPINDQRIHKEKQMNTERYIRNKAKYSLLESAPEIAKKTDALEKNKIATSVGNGSIGSTSAAQAPVVSILTSVYKGDAFIEGFMQDITRQTMFNQCELIMINANSPGNEEDVIKRYMALYPNIIYRKLDTDPGVYGVWNMAIAMSKGEFLTNANLDDRLKPDCYEQHVKALRADPSIDLIYSDFYRSKIANQIFEQIQGNEERAAYIAEFSKANMRECLPNNHPMWRKTLHDKYGLFDASYKCAGDFEMWLRAVDGGAQFKKLKGHYGVFYENPKGLSNEDANNFAYKECVKVGNQYAHVYKVKKAAEELYCGQLMQDKFLNETVFKNKKNGVFVDIGAHDGKTFSNSYFFEKTLNWSGICIEPMPEIFQKLKQARSCICVNGCVAGFTGEASFLHVISKDNTNMLSGLLDNYDLRHLKRITQEVQSCCGSTEILEVKCYTLTDLLNQHNIAHVDYLSIDTQGSEYEILKAIDFKAIDIQVIEVENNYKDASVATLLEKNGYSLLKQIGWDDVYIKNKA